MSVTSRCIQTLQILLRIGQAKTRRRSFSVKNANIHTTRLLSTATAMAKISTACPMAIFLNILSHQNSKGGEKIKKKKKSRTFCWLVSGSGVGSWCCVVQSVCLNLVDCDFLGAVRQWRWDGPLSVCYCQNGWKILKKFLASSRVYNNSHPYPERSRCSL